MCNRIELYRSDATLALPNCQRSSPFVRLSSQAGRPLYSVTHLCQLPTKNFFADDRGSTRFPQALVRVYPGSEACQRGLQGFFCFSTQFPKMEVLHKIEWELPPQHAASIRTGCQFGIFGEITRLDFRFVRLDVP